MIGSGIFVLPNVIARSVPSYAGIVAAWLIGGVLSFFGALAYAELGAMLPATGGQYVYLREAYGPMCAFVCGWTFMLAVLAGGSAWMAVTFSIYLGYFVPLTPVAAKAIAVVLIAVLSAVNYCWGQGRRVGAAHIHLFESSCLSHPDRGRVLQPQFRLHLHRAVRARSTGFAHFGVAMAACLMAYNGWSYVSFVAGEVKDPERNLLRSLVIGMAVVAVLYVLANLAYLKVMTIPEIAGCRASRRGCGHADNGPDRRDVRIVGRAAFDYRRDQRLHPDGARIPFAQARDGLFFARFGEAHPRYQTPGFAIVCAGIWTAVLVVTGSYETLYTYSILAAWIFYTMSVAAVMVLRRKMPDAARPYRMWAYPWTLWLFVAVSVWFMADAVVTQPRPSAMALVIVVTGALAYWMWRRLSRTPG